MSGRHDRLALKGLCNNPKGWVVDNKGRVDRQALGTTKLPMSIDAISFWVP